MNCVRKRTRPLWSLVTLWMTLAASPAWAQAMKVVTFGDSYIAGKGLSNGELFQPQLERLLKAKGESVQVLNRGVSGDSTRDLLARIGPVLSEDAQVVVTRTPRSNDQRLGLDAMIAGNMEEIVHKFVDRRARLLLLVKGRDNAVFKYLVEKYGIALVDISSEPSSNTLDGRHMNAEGHKWLAGMLVEPVYEQLQRAKVAR
jgi:acyl-CoA thioesterase I